ncbi:ferrochelatase [Edaphobacter dinghuensis]|uniref:Ferrochelatase n=1 Tax=Edaphobacter dinghuensis TaxID=1560005 RepID=A0A917MAG5_9BACT|nr:ferrochelatase [Edaphobacter dinghuensis]GGG89309.1 ferrochelatase [Edaphobacter dinghuensis]
MSGEAGRSAVLLLAHGTPDVLGEMAAYLSKVTGGRPLPQEVVEELQHRYRQIGLGETPGAEAPPLTKWTLIQAHLLERSLDRNGDSNTRVYVGMRNWHPYIADAIAQMRLDGVTHIKAICLAPQNSRTSVGLYRKAVLAAADGLEVDFVAGWAEHPLLAQAFAERLWPVWALACAQSKRRVPVLFTAHSVPCRTVMTKEASDNGASQQEPPDTYAVEAKRTAELVAQHMAPVGFGEKDWYFAFQSQGVSGGPWIGPTVEETLKSIKDEGHVGVVMQPIGFLCDHVEILYDIDIAFTEKARELGLKLWRAESLNDSDVLINALTQIATGQYKAVVDEAIVPAQV